MVLTSALSIVATAWTDSLEVVPLAGLVGLIAGLLLSISTFRRGFSHLVSIVYGTAWVGFLASQGLSKDLSWRERVFELGTRIAGWVQEALSGGTSQDSLIFLILLSVLFWILGYSAAWNTYRRRRPWLTAVPLGIASIAAAHFYVGDAPLLRYLILYLLLALLYIGRAQTSRQEMTWREEQVAYDPKLGINVLRSSLALALLVLTLAWALPSASATSTSVSEIWERINTPWEAVEEEWQRLFSSVHSGEIETAEPFGSSLALGGPSALEGTLVLDVQAPPIGRYYWRATVYGTYTGSQWNPARGDVVSLPPGSAAKDVQQEASRRLVSQTVTNYLPGRHLLVGASQPLAVGREAEVLARVEDGSPRAFHRLSSVLPLGAGEQYTVTSRTSQANAVELRQAGSDYPAWVSTRYLQLPGTLPERVGVLAERITREAGAPYDKARLLEQYLRETIVYDLNPPEPPPGRDYVDFLLFESQRGYCNGYATAMVVMARSLGIPARLASGYAEGAYDEQRGIYRVREDNAHSWPEIFFPGYGWIEFEPTVSQTPLIRPEPDPGTASHSSPPPATGQQDLMDDLMLEESAPPLLEEGPQPVPDQEKAPVQGPPLWVWAGGGLVLLLVVAGWWAAENVGLRRLPAAEQAYARLLRFGRWVGRPLQTPDTPIEWAQDLSTMVPKAKEPIDRIVGLFVEAQFGRGDSRDPAADISWHRARGPLWRHILWEQWLDRLGLTLEKPGAKS